MKKIDRETVNRILDAADIVEVVSDFVTLKKRGANYIGLCPFHSERTPSFSVSKSKGYCKCFSCGKGGSAVSFLMELEQMSYTEALRWLAKKYNITVHEREETDEEKQLSSQREALFAVNTFALNHFEKNLHETEDGRNIGLAYFHERCLSDDTIKKFHLGYALEKSDAFYKEAIKNGYLEENLLKTGLCAKSEKRDGAYDRFRGRVIYPIHSFSGKIVAFGGRTLRNDKTVAKYVNSPESEIYSKSRELYGLFHARRAIGKEDKCYLVEGYMDVISMSQSGVENVVASSGTSLTTQQVNLLHRYTNNVTVIYDSDAAGIKASLRGVNMLLKEGLNVRTVLFPDGEDPDSYARSHTKEELKDYLDKNETDFIKFKIKVLLQDAGDDPLKRSQVITDILQSIAVIPSSVTRQVYIEEVGRTFGMDSKMLSLEVNKYVRQMADTPAVCETIVGRKDTAIATDRTGTEPASVTTGNKEVSSEGVSSLSETKPTKGPLYDFELAIIRYMLRYGMVNICEDYNEDGTITPATVIDYVLYELEKDNITFSEPVLAQIFEEIKKKAAEWNDYEPILQELIETKRAELMAEGLERIRQSAASLGEIYSAENDLKINVEDRLSEIVKEHRRNFLCKIFISDPDDDIRNIATQLVIDKYQLSKVHSKFTKVETEEERLPELLPRAIFELQDAILELQIRDLEKQLQTFSSDPVKAKEIMSRLMEKMKIRQEFAQFLGERIIVPKYKMN